MSTTATWTGIGEESDLTAARALGDRPARNGICAKPGATPWVDCKAANRSARAAEARRRSGRRRGVEPATTDRIYTSAEVEFMNAMQEYKLRSGRMFPTWSEVLEVLCSLGYCKPSTDPQDWHRPQVAQL